MNLCGYVNDDRHICMQSREVHGSELGMITSHEFKPIEKCPCCGFPECGHEHFDQHIFEALKERA